MKCLPSKWFPPFGLDKLAKVIRAEKSKTYPLLMLEDHELYGDTYAQWGGPVYTIITRDPRNLREFLSRQFKSNLSLVSPPSAVLRPVLTEQTLRLAQAVMGASPRSLVMAYLLKTG